MLAYLALINCNFSLIAPSFSTSWHKLKTPSEMQCEWNVFVRFKAGVCWKWRMGSHTAMSHCWIIRGAGGHLAIARGIEPKYLSTVVTAAKNRLTMAHCLLSSPVTACCKHTGVSLCMHKHGTRQGAPSETEHCGPELAHSYWKSI